jgi:hypothetical protein
MPENEPVTTVDDIRCPACGSDDVRGTGRPVEGVLPLSCEACGQRWTRVPRQVCGRCASSEVRTTPIKDSWEFGDKVAARDDPSTDDWFYRERYISRCEQCQLVWEWSPRPEIR